MGKARIPAVRPDTIAFARRGRVRPVSYASILVGRSVEDELIFTRVMAKKLLRLLQQREPRVADAFLDELTIDARATLDRTFEAMLILFFNRSTWRRRANCCGSKTARPNVSSSPARGWKPGSSIMTN